MLKGDSEKDHRPARDRIIEAAFQLFTEKGIEATTTREIAAHAGVNEVTLFRHFGNKDGIVRAAVEHSIPHETLPVFDQLELSGQLEHDLRLLTQTIVDNHERRQDFFRFVFANIVQHPEHRDFFADMHEPLLEWMTRFFTPHCERTDLDPEVVAIEFIAPIVMRSIRKFFLDQVLIDDATFIDYHARLLAAALNQLQEPTR
ncbi:MAG: TetR/AcrR family transcriptional regulator [Candidatus Dadabacteria bacterium]|nr:MAG: TetR/AcrR family transcriptional regulator [Candidatus Dadabacteria bacterium]